MSNWKQFLFHRQHAFQLELMCHVGRKRFPYPLAGQSHVLQLKLTVFDGDWDLIRQQTRQVMRRACDTQQIGKEKTLVPGGSLFAQRRKVSAGSPNLANIGEP